MKEVLKEGDKKSVIPMLIAQCRTAPSPSVPLPEGEGQRVREQGWGLNK